MPELSLFAPAAHPELWMAFYDSLGPTSVDFECIFVGPTAPSYSLPSRCRFIQTNVKPVQACEIGLRTCTGELVMNFADDFVFKTIEPLERMIALYRSLADPKKMVSPKYYVAGHAFDPRTHLFDVLNPESPRIPVCGLASRELWLSTGGADRNFVGLYWDLDISMRICAAGGSVELAEVMVMEELDKKGRSSLANDYWTRDHDLLIDLWMDGEWMKGGAIRKERRRPVEGFLPENILTVTQGVKGRWE